MIRDDEEKVDLAAVGDRVGDAVSGEAAEEHRVRPEDGKLAVEDCLGGTGVCGGTLAPVG